MYKIKKSLLVCLLLGVLSSALPDYAHASARDELVSNELDSWEKVVQKHNDFANEMHDQVVKRDYDKSYDQREDEKEESTKRKKTEEYTRKILNKNERKPWYKRMMIEQDGDNHLERNINVELYWQTFFSKYKEPDVMEQEGWMHGVEGRVTFRKDEGEEVFGDMISMFRLEGMFASGDFDYEAIASPQTGLMMIKKIICMSFVV